jgi:hypothetical protein
MRVEAMEFIEDVVNPDEVRTKSKFRAWYLQLIGGYKLQDTTKRATLVGKKPALKNIYILVKK